MSILISSVKMNKRRMPYIALIVLVIASLLTAGISSPVLAATDSTTVGTLSLPPAYENISVFSNFSGDDNGNNQAVLHYRKVGALTWNPGIPMTPDRREQVTWCSYETGETLLFDNDYKNQWRSVIFGLEPNSEYEVRVTYSDPEGVSGSPAIATVKTLNDNPPSNGNHYYVSPSGNDAGSGSQADPFRTIQHAVDITLPGDTVFVMPGTYLEEVYIDWTHSGEPDNYITIRSYDLGNKAIIDGENGRWRCIWLNYASYVRIKGFQLQYPSFSGDGINVQIDGCEGIIVEDCDIIEPGGQWGSAGIRVYDIQDTQPCTNGLIQRNTITGSDLAPNTRYGIFFWGHNPGWTIKDNTIIFPGAKDGIGGGFTESVFIHGNHIEDTWDDAFEVEGPGINVAIFDNFYNGNALMALGMAPVTWGPYYVLRNVFSGTFTDAGLKMGNSSEGYSYIYHNTIHTWSGKGIGHFGNNPKVNNAIFKNNIVIAGNYVIENWEGDPDWSHCEYDYNNLYTSLTGDKFAKWPPETDPPGYMTWEAFKAGTGFEQHGISVDTVGCRFADVENYDFRLLEDSPCIDKGVVLPGFNDENSPWPYQGSAPDIGAYELASGPPPDPGPLHHITITPSSSSLTIGQSQQFSATGYDENNIQLIDLSFTWSVVNPDAGSIDGNGLFTVGTVEGTCTDVIKAEVDSIAGYASVSITAPAPNEPPVAEDDAYSVDENTTLNVATPGVLANDSDANGDPLTAVLVSDVSNGNLILNTDGSFSYTPTADFNGTDSFTYRANDGQADSSIATVSITVSVPTATFGLNNGDMTWEDEADWLTAMRFQCPENGTVIKLELLFDDDSPNGNVRMGVYEDDNGSPGNLLLDAGTTAVADGWVGTSGLSLAVTQNTYYWLSFCISDGNGIRYQSGQAADSLVWKAHSYGPFPDPFGDPEDRHNAQYVMRATYTTEEVPNALGDADGDGSVTSLDITKLERIIMGLDDPTAGADANEDGSINTLDITKIELIIMGG